jgi:hypothetical protein
MEQFRQHRRPPDDGRVRPKHVVIEMQEKRRNYMYTNKHNSSLRSWFLALVSACDKRCSSEQLKSNLPVFMHKRPRESRGSKSSLLQCASHRLALRMA